jgi:hypothetical protein
MATLIIVGSFFAFVALIVVMRIVRRMAHRHIERPMNVDLTIADAHRIFERGDISAEEFEVPKRKILERDAARARAATEARSMMPPIGRGGGAPGRVIKKPPPGAPPPTAPDKWHAL